MMMLEPRNRHLLVYICEEPEPEQERTVLLPESYESPKSPYAAASVLAVAPDVGQHVLAGETIIIERSMLNEVTFEGETFYLVLENYILGIVEREV